MNKVTMIGRLGADPDYRTFNANGEERGVVNFRIAVTRPFTRDETDWFNCAAFGRTADIIAERFSKGDRIAVSGFLKTRAYENRSGDTVTAVEINVDDFDFIETKREQSSDSSAHARPQSPQKKKAPVKSAANEDEVFGAADDDDDDWE